VKRVGMVGLVFAITLALGAMSSTSALAVTECRRVIGGEVSKFKKRDITGVCEGTLATNGFVQVESGTGMPFAAGIECYHVIVGEISAFGENKCKTAKAGTSEYIKVDAKKCIEGEEEAKPSVIFHRFTTPLVAASFLSAFASAFEGTSG